MAYTRAQVRDKIRQQCDLENVTTQTDTELNEHINDAASDVHAFLIATLGARYAYAASTMSTIAGQSLYVLGTGSSPLIADDFHRLIAVKLRVDGISYPLGSFEIEDTATYGGAAGTGTGHSWGPGNMPRYAIEQQRDGSFRLLFEPPPDAINTVEIIYHPGPPTWISDALEVGIPWLELLIVEACIRVKRKEERDASNFERERAIIQKRVEDWASPVDRANPPRTIRAPGRFSPLWRRGRWF